MNTDRASHGAEPTTGVDPGAESEPTELMIDAGARALRLIDTAAAQRSAVIAIFKAMCNARASPPTTRVDPGAETLLPCPFCGEQPELNEWPEYASAQVCCENGECPIQPHTPGERDGPSYEIAVWNRRASPPTTGEADLLREIAKTDAPYEWQLETARRKRWRELAKQYGGEFYGPNIEHVTFPETEFFKMMAANDAANAALRDKLAEETEAHAQLQARCFDYGGSFQNVFDDLKAARVNAERYAEFRRAVYIEQDESFDAYDAEGMDEELDRRIAGRRSAQAAEGEKDVSEPDAAIDAAIRQAALPQEGRTA